MTTTTLTIAEQALKFIEDAIKFGQTVYITNPMRSIKITPKNYEKWWFSKVPLFEINKDGNLTIASGNNRNTIATKTNCLLKITAK